jgi:ABC-2 type transport system ATP-binding protein
MSTAAVHLTHIEKTFGGTCAVDNLSLEVPEGSVYGFIGPNGSGKTTTLRIIMHILLPDTGKVEVLGRSSTHAANDSIGYLPEERGLYRKMSVRRLLAYYASLKGMDGPQAQSEGQQWLERLGLAAWADKRVEVLSKGMTQKLQFIATVISKPKLVILDEPFSGLDPVNLEAMRQAILDLRDHGTTVILSTHDMDIAEEMCDFICMIYKGKKVLDGTLDSIQSRYSSDTVRLDVDGGRETLKAVGLTDIHDLGHFQEARLNGFDAQELLKKLATRTQVRHFEVRRPTLRDVFLRIAGTEAQDA